MMHSIIIITDDIIFPHYFIYLLERYVTNVHVFICDSFIDIDDKLAKSRCKFIIIDDALTKLSSVDVIQHLRFVKYVPVPIWLFAESRPEDYIAKCLLMGVTRTIMKPFDSYEVCGDIKSLIRD